MTSEDRILQQLERITERLHKAESVEELRDILTEILLGRDVAGA